MKYLNLLAITFLLINAISCTSEFDSKLVVVYIKDDTGVVTRSDHTWDTWPGLQRGKGRHSIAVLTQMVNVSLGDFSAASKLITMMQDRFKDELDIIWLIKAERPELARPEMLPGSVKTVLFGDWNSLVQPGIKQILDQVDLTVAFPTFHWLNQSQTAFLAKEIRSRFVRVTEYDFQEWEGVPFRELPILKTGLCHDCLGIFIEPEVETSASKSSDWVEELVAQSSYPHSLHFGYFNPHPGLEYKGSWSSLSNFVVLTTLIELKKGDHERTATVVVPATEEQFQHIANLLRDKADLRVQLVYENHKTKSQKEIQIGKDKSPLTVKIVNAFPLGRNDLLKIVQASAPLVGTTGDQSLSEALQFEKIPFYQIMRWKSDLFFHLVKTLESTGGCESALCDFLDLNKRSSLSINALDYKAQQYVENESSWLDAIAKLRQEIESKKNLNINLPQALEDLLNEATAS